MDITQKITTPLKVSRKIQETEDTYSFQFEIADDLKAKFAYQAGQFVTLFLNVNGQNISRSYSLSTSPAFDKTFQITVKRVIGGLGSNYLADHVEEDDTVLVTPPQGTFFRPLAPSPGNSYFLFAAGSGITPIFSILKEILTTRPDERVYLFFSNRSEKDVIYKNPIENLKQQFSDRLFVTYMLSQPTSTRLTLVGRCSSLLVKNFVTEHSEGAQYRQAYMCGPEGFMEQVEQGLQLAGLGPHEIRKESFGTPITPAAPTASSDFNLDDKYVIGDAAAPLGTPQRLTAILGGETVEVAINPDLSLLENLIEAGHNPPYSCMNGACMACMGRIKSGRVYQDDPGVLTEENMAAGETLSCQARAITPFVTIDYDDF